MKQEARVDTAPEEPNKKVTAAIVLTDDLMKRLDTEAHRRTMSRSLLIRLACERLLADAQKEKAA